MDCGICKQERLRLGKEPLEVVRLPVEATQHRLFRHKSDPITLCPECDGAALDLARRQYPDRLAST